VCLLMVPGFGNCGYIGLEVSDLWGQFLTLFPSKEDRANYAVQLDRHAKKVSERQSESIAHQGVGGWVWVAAQSASEVEKQLVWRSSYGTESKSKGLEHEITFADAMLKGELVTFTSVLAKTFSAYSTKSNGIQVLFGAGVQVTFPRDGVATIGALLSIIETMRSLHLFALVVYPTASASVSGPAVQAFALIPMRSTRDNTLQVNPTGSALALETKASDEHMKSAVTTHLSRLIMTKFGPSGLDKLGKIVIPTTPKTLRGSKRKQRSTSKSAQDSANNLPHSEKKGRKDDAVSEETLYAEIDRLTNLVSTRASGVCKRKECVKLRTTSACAKCPSTAEKTAATKAVTTAGLVPDLLNKQKIHGKEMTTLRAELLASEASLISSNARVQELQEQLQTRADRVAAAGTISIADLTSVATMLAQHATSTRPAIAAPTAPAAVQPGPGVVPFEGISFAHLTSLQNLGLLGARGPGPG
jgi:hypothetical protein